MQTSNLNPEKDLIEESVRNSKLLFELYRSLHFIYPAKMERLARVFDIVEENWEKAIKLDFPLFWVLKTKRNSHNIISTGTQWQYLNKGMIGQHLASNNPVGTRVTFLAMLQKIIKEQHGGCLDSYQIYYRPQNKYSSRVFEPLSIKAGQELSAIIPYNYYEIPFLQNDVDNEVDIVEINNGNTPDFINFIQVQQGKIFVKAQELESDDINLIKLNSKFNTYGLKRMRRVLVARSAKDNKIYGAIIVNQSSLGLNFSFFENSSELILCKGTCPEFLTRIARKLLYKASRINMYSPLQWLPVLTDPVHAPIIESLNGSLTRNYNLFIMLKGGYEIWYDHVDQLTNLVYQRFINHSTEKYA